MWTWFRSGKSERSARESTSTGTPTVYEAGRRWLRTELQRLRRHNRLLWVALLLSLASHGVQSWGLAQAAAKPGAIAFRVDVDRHHQVRAAGPVEPLPPPGEGVIRSEIGNTIINLRRIYPDPVALNDLQVEGRSRLRGEALRYVDRYFGEAEHNPYYLAAEKMRRVDVTNVLRVKGDSWKVEWIETEYPLGGGGGRASLEQAWGAVVTVAVIPGTQPEEIAASPYGVYLTALDWAARSEPSPSAAGGPAR